MYGELRKLTMSYLLSVHFHVYIKRLKELNIYTLRYNFFPFCLQAIHNFFSFYTIYHIATSTVLHSFDAFCSLLRFQQCSRSLGDSGMHHLTSSKFKNMQHYLVCYSTADEQLSDSHLHNILYTLHDCC